jgi:hypothetical protein
VSAAAGASRTVVRHLLPASLVAIVAALGCDEPGDRYALENEDVDEVTPADVPRVDWPELSAWDADGDGRLDRADLEEALGAPGYFESWDGDGDGVLIRSEYYGGLFARWKGDDQVIARDEYRAAVDAWFPGVEWEFMAFDGNQDGFVNEVELVRTMQRTDTFQTLDTDEDGTLGRAEVAEGMLRRWDTDGDGYVGRSEWRFG